MKLESWFVLNAQNQMGKVNVLKPKQHIQKIYFPPLSWQSNEEVMLFTFMEFVSERNGCIICMFIIFYFLIVRLCLLGIL